MSGTGQGKTGQGEASGPDWDEADIALLREIARLAAEYAVTLDETEGQAGVEARHAASDTLTPWEVAWEAWYAAVSAGAVRRASQG